MIIDADAHVLETEETSGDTWKSPSLSIDRKLSLLPMRVRMMRFLADRWPASSQIAQRGEGWAEGFS